MKLEWPLKEIGTKPGVYITQLFGQKLNDYTQFGLVAHNGLDIAAPRGTPIYASHDGRITFYTEDPPGYGKNVRLFFDETVYMYELTYGHLDRYEGTDRDVKVGDVIGYVDNTGFSSGDHLHFGVRRYINGQVENYNNGYLGYVDPEPFFRKDIMSNAIFTHKTGTQEYGFYLPALSEDALKDKALNLGLDILKPDGTIDYTKARDI